MERERLAPSKSHSANVSKCQQLSKAFSCFTRAHIAIWPSRVATITIITKRSTRTRTRTTTMTNRMRTWTLNSKRNINNSNYVSQVKQSTRVPIVIIASFRSTEPVIVYFKPWAIPLAISDGGANLLGDDGPGRRGRHPDQLAVQLPPHVQHVRHGPPDDQQHADRAHKVGKSRIFESVFVSSQSSKSI